MNEMLSGDTPPRVIVALDFPDGSEALALAASDSERRELERRLAALDE